MQSNIFNNIKTKPILIGLCLFWIPNILSSIHNEILNPLISAISLIILLNWFVVFLAGWYSIVTFIGSFIIMFFIDNNLWHLDLALITLGTAVYVFKNKISILLLLTIFLSIIIIGFYLVYIVNYVNFYSFIESKLILLFSQFQNNNVYVDNNVYVNINYEIISIFLPFIVCFSILILLFISMLSSNYFANKVFLIESYKFNYIVPYWYNWLLVIIMLVTVASHKMLDNNYNLYYTMYNIMFLGFIPYIKAGIKVLNYYIFNKNLYNIVLIVIAQILFVIFFIIFMWYVLFAVCILGFLKETAIISVE